MEICGFSMAFIKMETCELKIIQHFAFLLGKAMVLRVHHLRNTPMEFQTNLGGPLDMQNLHHRFIAASDI